MHGPLPHRGAPATGVAHTLHRDYETRSNANLPKVGVDKYAADPSTEVLCAAYAVDDGPVQVPLIPSERIHFGKRLMGVDREDFSNADPNAFEAAQAVVGIQPNEDRSRTASSVMFRLSVKQREWFEDLVARAGP